jgi:voltage-gated potassium channel Kch
VAAYTAFAALVTLFRDQADVFRLRMMRRHVVVCGIGRKGMGLVRHYQSQGLKIVVIENDDENDFIEVCREMNVLVLIGKATDEGILRRARVQLAERVVALTGNDGTNVEIAVRKYQLVKSEGERIAYLSIFPPNGTGYWIGVICPNTSVSTIVKKSEIFRRSLLRLGTVS